MVQMFDSSTIKPFELISSSGVITIEVQFIREAIEQVLQIANVFKLIQVKERSEYTDRINKYLSQSLLNGTENYNPQIDIIRFIEIARSNDLINTNNYFVIVLAQNIIVSEDDDTYFRKIDNELSKQHDEYTPGISYCYRKNLRGFVISTLRFKDLDNEKEVLKTAVFHEMGHILNAAEGMIGKSMSGENKYYNHCFNNDVMRQQEDIPKDIIIATEQRLNTGIIYCDQCINSIKEFFRK